jgi:hypothetical protein
MNQHLLVKMPERRVRRSGIFPGQLNDPELIRGSLTELFDDLQGIIMQGMIRIFANEQLHGR